MEYEIDENYVEPHPPPIIADTKPLMTIEEFVLPDSLPGPLIIAAYDEEIPTAGRTVIMYTDSTRQSAKKISYQRDGKVSVVPLIIKGNGEYKSVYTEETYQVEPDRVIFGYQSGQVAVSHDYLRMDNYGR